MEAKICDRCNEYYTKKDHDEACKKATMYLKRKPNEFNAFKNYDYIDLCPECWKNLEEWFRWKK